MDIFTTIMQTLMANATLLGLGFGIFALVAAMVHVALDGANVDDVDDADSITFNAVRRSKAPATPASPAQGVDEGLGIVKTFNTIARDYRDWIESERMKLLANAQDDYPPVCSSPLPEYSPPLPTGDLVIPAPPPPSGAPVKSPEEREVLRSNMRNLRNKQKKRR